MKKLDKLLIKSYLGPFVLTFCIALFLLLMQFVWKYIDDLVGKGLEWYIIAELLFYTSASLVPLALPLAVLLSSIMTFGNLGENYELVAFKSSGVSLIRIMRPLIITAMLISGLAFLFSNNILPYSNLKAGSLLYDVRQKRPALNIKEGVFYNGIDGYSLKVSKKDPDGITMRNMMIYDHTARTGNSKVIIADSGRMYASQDKSTMILTLYSGYSYEEMQENVKYNERRHPLIRSTFKEEILRFDLSGFAFERTDEDLFKNNYQMMNINQLMDSKDTIHMEIREKKDDYFSSLKENYYSHLFNNDTVNTPKKTDSSSFKEPDGKLTTGIRNKELSTINKPDSRGGNASPSENKYTFVSLLADTAITHNNKLKIIQTASNIARSTKSYTKTIKEDLRHKQEQLNRHDVEFYKKFTLSFACLILFFTGAPLGAIIRKGGLGMPVVVSVFIFIGFHVLTISGEKMVKEGVLVPEFGMWLASLVVLPIGILLTYKAATDSPVMESEAYSKFIKRLLSLFKRKPAVQ